MLITFSLPRLLIGFGVLLLFVALIIRWSRLQGSVAPVPIVPALLNCEACLQLRQLQEYRYRDGMSQRNVMLCTSCAVWLEATRVEGTV